MLRYAQAEQLAEMLLEFRFAGKAVLLKEQTLALPYGWVFYFQSRRWVETRKLRDAFIGNSPFLIDRLRSEVRNIGAADVNDWLREYEKTLHPGDLKPPPEPPAQ